jgi:phosphoglycolate phosphatase-like HAD superfamily hydrolase
MTAPALDLLLAGHRGVIELLNVLNDTGLPRAVATSSCREDAQRDLAACGLLDRIDAMLATTPQNEVRALPDDTFRPSRPVRRAFLESTVEVV